MDEIEDIVKERETRQFLLKHLKGREGRDVNFNDFLEGLQKEYNVVFNEEIERIQFEDILHAKLTTSNTESLSLNAL